MCREVSQISPAQDDPPAFPPRRPTSPAWRSSSPDRVPDVMRCTKPFVSGMAAFGCGQCLPCRFNRRRVWTHRIMLEALSNSENAFVTLTYAEDRWSLDPAHLSGFMKRLRSRVRPQRVRFYGVGEYGDKSERPHYHAALFGFGQCLGGLTIKGECKCRNCSVVRETWGHGHVLVGALTRESSQYIAGYVVKKMTSKDDPRLEGRYPEFSRMSLRPGVGADALWDVASAMMQFGQDKRLVSQLRHGHQVMPLGRYLRIKLSKMVGHSDEERASLSDQALTHLYEQMLMVYRVAIADGTGAREVLRQVNEPFEKSLANQVRTRKRVI